MQCDDRNANSGTTSSFPNGNNVKEFVPQGNSNMQNNWNSNGNGFMPNGNSNGNSNGFMPNNNMNNIDLSLIIT